MVSIIMPAYNAEKYIEEAVRSVMAQTYKEWELLIIDDCSTDNTFEIIKSFKEKEERIKIFKNEKNLGVARTRNRGIDISEGEYVAFIDSDDAWFPEKLFKQVKKMEETGAAFSYCSYEIMDFNGNKCFEDFIVPEEVDFRQLLKQNVIGCSTSMISSEIIKKYYFNKDFYHEDFVFWLSILKDGHKACGLTEVLSKWRYVNNSRSFDKKQSAINCWKIYRQYLGFSFFKSLYYFIGYVIAGLKKYK